MASRSAAPGVERSRERAPAEGRRPRRSADGYPQWAGEFKRDETGRSARFTESSWLDLIPEDMLAPAEEPVRRRVPRPAPRPEEGVREEGTSTARRTVTIRGQVAPPARPVSTTLRVPRRPPPRAYERVGARPDRVAMYAVILGVLLVLAAVLSVHG